MSENGANGSKPVYANIRIDTRDLADVKTAILTAGRIAAANGDEPKRNRLLKLSASILTSARRHD